VFAPAPPAPPTVAPPPAPPAMAAPPAVPPLAPPVDAPPTSASVPPPDLTVPFPPPPPEPRFDPSSSPGRSPPPPPVQLAVLIGIISVPRPIEIDALLKFGGSIALGAQFSMLPTLTFPGQDARVELSATQAVFRWFPFRGAFYLGGGFGYQQFKASLGDAVQGGTLTVNADMSTVFLSPQLGWVWTWESGFALGISLGVQLPLPREPVVTVAYNGQVVPENGAGFPAPVVTAANSDRDTIEDIARVVMRYPIPNLDLLKIGFAF
jgi:hypothetical protein